MRPVVHILILAAGASSRMRGRDKLLQPVKGKPILRLVVDIALGTGAPVVVTLPPLAEARRQVLVDSAARIVEVLDAQLGMSRSIARGLDLIRGGDIGADDGVMILPADMPGFSTNALADLVSRFRAEPDLIWRGGTIAGQAGHPAIFPRDLWDSLAAVTGDEGGRSVLLAQQDRVRVVPLPGEMAVLDLDTPEDWATFLGRPASSA
jgi:molybdenum cofactor cytidylyltransferase